MDPNRVSLIRMNESKWVNGTVLHYYFFNQASDGEYITYSDGTQEWKAWVGDETQKVVVRKAFDVWKDVGIGLQFTEVTSRSEAEIRIGFMDGDGSWSYVGRDVLKNGPDARTMNFGWDLTRHPNELDTAVHEIGHTLGFPHEHQNPNAGIVWNEEAVYSDLAGYPNYWSREKTYYNIIRKIEPDQVQGSNWDYNSIMHYPFAGGLIKAPPEFVNGLQPADGLSARDKTWVKNFYPPLDSHQYQELRPFESVALAIGSGEQKNFVFKPDATRKYTIQTFGISDTVMVLFEDENGDLRYVTGDDDSGKDYNANIEFKLFKGRRYVLRIRLYYSHLTGETTVMLW